MDILIVEPEKDLFEIISAFILESYSSAQFTQASDVAEALDLLKEKDFDLILSEYEFHDGSVWPIIDSVRSTAHQTKIAVITARFLDDESDLSNKNIQCLHKPFTCRSLKNLIQTSLETNP